MNENKYTVQQINDRINDTVSRVAKSGETGGPIDEDEDLNNLVNEVAKARMDSPYYMIGQTDIDSYLEDRIKDVSPQNRDLFEQYARKYINNCGGLGEQISICLDIAFEETELTEDEEEPTEDEPG